MNTKKILFLFTAFTFVSAPAFAIPAKVIKTGGKRAVVEFPRGTKVSAGEILNFSFGEGESGSSSSGAPGSRKNYIGLGGSMNFNLDAAEGASAFSINSYEVEFGWNFGRFEFAPSVSIGKTDAFTWGFAGQFDVNFAENKAGTTFVPAFTGSVGITKGITIPMKAGLAGKIFILRQSPSAIRLGLTFDLTKFANATVKNISILDLSIQTYF